MITFPKQGISLIDGQQAVPGKHFLRWLRLGFIALVRERFAPSIHTKNYTAKAWDAVKVDPTAGTLVVTMPERSVDGDEVLVSNSTNDATPITVAAGAGDTVDGDATKTLWGSRFSSVFVYDVIGRNWMEI